MTQNIFSNTCANCTRNCPFAQLPAKRRELFCLFLQPAYQELTGENDNTFDIGLHPSLRGAMLLDFDARLN